MSLKTERDLNPTGRNQLARAKTAAQSKNFDYAIALLQSLLKDEPLFLDGRKLLRAVEINKNKTKTGSFFKGMGLTGGLGGLKMGASKKSPQEQLIQAEEMLASDPYSVKGNQMIGEAGTALGYPEFKCFAFETLREGKPTDKAILNSLAEAYMEMKDGAKAEKVYESILEIYPTDGEALSGLKNALAAKSQKEGKWEEAEKAGDFRTSLKDKNEANQLEQESKTVLSTDAIEDQIRSTLRGTKPSRRIQSIPSPLPNFTSSGTITDRRRRGTSMPSRRASAAIPHSKKRLAISS